MYTSVHFELSLFFHLSKFTYMYMYICKHIYSHIQTHTRKHSRIHTFTILRTHLTVIRFYKGENYYHKSKSPNIIRNNIQLSSCRELFVF